MTVFASKAAPSLEKLRGGYYTPAKIADFLATWVGEAGTKQLEPSCGDGVVLAALERLAGHVVGIELNEAEAAKAQAAAPGACVVVDDFFSWFSAGQWGAWHGVAGNPPFIRYGSWTEPARERAFAVMREVGMRPTKLTNAWVPFVVAGALSLCRDGRMGMVVPAELMQVNYAAELRAFLVDHFSELTVVTFRRLVFDEVLQEVVLLLGICGEGPARMRVVEVEDFDVLPNAAELRAIPHAPALRHETEKWTKYFLDARGISALRSVRDGELLGRLGELADVDVGVVTGRNQFFVMRPSTAIERGVQRHLVPLVSRSAHLRGVRFADSDLARLREEDAPCELLALSDTSEPGSDDMLARYIAAGESDGVHEGYKCSIRRRWWVVPSQWTPDAFLFRQIHDHPRIIANLTAATSTDTIHRVRMTNGLAPEKLAAASINTATFAFSEVVGRSYGGGVLELEPREAEALPFPDPKPLAKSDVARVDRLLREGALEAALDHVDAKLLGHVEPELLTELRRVWLRLRDRRLARGRRSG
ncbi:MAG TPA: class I SAM-dependent methyltransferase [Solirubrobacteraceae bacterium]|nr:class I SAM-dependent methyltransferase [Solirubrobacteraceae bacterium]